MVPGTTSLLSRVESSYRWLAAHQAYSAQHRRQRVAGDGADVVGLVVHDGLRDSHAACHGRTDPLAHIPRGEPGSVSGNESIRQLYPLSMPVTSFREKALFDEADRVLGKSAEEVARQLGIIGKNLGAPWAQDQKLCTLAAWLTLATV